MVRPPFKSKDTLSVILNGFVMESVFNSRKTPMYWVFRFSCWESKPQQNQTSLFQDCSYVEFVVVDSLFPNVSWLHIYNRFHEQNLRNRILELWSSRGKLVQVMKYAELVCGVMEIILFYKLNLFEM